MSGKKPTRRSVSMTAVAYMRIGALAKQRGQSVSGLIETMIAAACDAAGVPAMERADAIAASAPKPAAARKDGAGGIFTF